MDNPAWDKYSKESLKEQHKLVKKLFEIIMIKDAQTTNHCRAVKYYSECIGKGCGLTSDEIKILKDAALLHDIGKITVDLAILHKPDRLLPAEKLQIRTHTEKGMKILEAFHLDVAIVDAAWHHHERIDGKGYPDGIKDISYYTRIISVADVIDAMSAQRPYREPASIKNILSELEMVSGTQLDTDICKVAKNMLEAEKIRIMG